MSMVMQKRFYKETSKMCTCTFYILNKSLSIHYNTYMFYHPVSYSIINIINIALYELLNSCMLIQINTRKFNNNWNMHPSFKHLQHWLLMEKVIHFKKGSNKIARVGFLVLSHWMGNSLQKGAQIIKKSHKAIFSKNTTNLSPNWRFNCHI